MKILQHTIVFLALSLIHRSSLAALIPVSADVYVTSGSVFSNLNASITGTYDPFTGDLQLSGGWANATNSVTLDWKINGLDGSQTYTSCKVFVIWGGDGCAAYPVGVTTPMNLVYNSVNLYREGSIRELIDNDAPSYINYRIAPTVVPVPAAGLLFGSAIIGLFRLRKASTIIMGIVHLVKIDEFKCAGCKAIK